MAKIKTGAKLLHVRLTMTSEVLGMEPANEDIHRKYIESKAPDAKTISDEVEALGVDAVDAEGTNIFYTDAEGNPCMADYQIKGFLKESSKFLKKAGKDGYELGKACSKWSQNVKDIDGCIFVHPIGFDPKSPTRFIKFDMGGLRKYVCVRFLRANTPMGERVAIAKSETVPEGSTLEFIIRLIKPENIDAVKECLLYGEEHGLGQWRNAGKGTFYTEIISCEDEVREI